MTNLVDSSGWLEFFANGPNAGFFAEAIEDVDRLIVPAPCLYEVFRCVMRQRGEGAALQAAAVMQHGAVVDLDAPLALGAAQQGLRCDLSAAGSVVLAVARRHGATLWTQDEELGRVDGVRFIRRKEAAAGR